MDDSEMETMVASGMDFTPALKPSVRDIAKAMEQFTLPDYICFSLMLLASVIVGIYFGFYRRHQNPQEYLMGGRTMSMFPVAMSLIASFISGISILGIPTEMYLFGSQYLYSLCGVAFMATIFNYIYLPVIYGLKLTSAYEYLERRFNKKVRVLASILFCIEMVCFLPIVIYVPALAINQVTGVNVHVVTPIICTICIFYTAVGGLRAVVWTDVIQASFMFGAMVLVAIKGTVDVGGLSTVWQRGSKTERFELPDFNPNPLTRHTIWSLTIGAGMYFIQQGAINQMMMQRYLSLPTLAAAKRASWFYFLGMMAIVSVCGYCGFLMYATFYDCDPLTTTLAREKDQLLPLLVMGVFHDWPGLMGVFIAGILSASLSSLSSGLNSLAAIILEDFCKLGLGHNFSEKHANLIIKLSVVIIGAVCLALVYVVEKLGQVLQLTMSVGTIASGPGLGLFTIGVLIPWINSNAAFFGASISLLLMAWIAIKAQMLAMSGLIVQTTKRLTTVGCSYTYPLKPTLAIYTKNDSQIFFLFRLSYLWYTLLGVLMTVIFGVVITWFTQPIDPRDIDTILLAPIVRKLIKPRRFSNQPNEDSVIYAFQNANESKMKKTEEILEMKLRQYNNPPESSLLQAKVDSTQNSTVN